MNETKLTVIVPDDEKMAKAIEQTLKPDSLEKDTSDLAIDEPVNIVDPENIVSTTLRELDMLPHEVLSELHDITIDIKYQLLPNVTVKLRK